MFYNYNYGQVMFKKDMYVGQLVAVKYNDNLWYRGRLLRSHRDEYEIFLVDLGRYHVVDIEDLRLLSKRFTKLPLQAFLGRVFGIQSYPDANEWSVVSCKIFSDLVKSNYHRIFLPLINFL